MLDSKTITVHTFTCDECHATAKTSGSKFVGARIPTDWTVDGFRHYCPNCRKYTKAELVEKVNNLKLHNALKLISCKQIQNPQLSTAWYNAQAYLQILEKMLGEK